MRMPGFGASKTPEGRLSFSFSESDNTMTLVPSIRNSAVFYEDNQRVSVRQGGDGMKTSFAWLSLLCAAGVALLAPCSGVFAQEGLSNVPTKTIVGDLLMIDRDLYIVRGDLGEIQIEATPQTEIAEAFQFGDRIKASVFMNNKALTIERAGPDDVPGVAENQWPPATTNAANTGKEDAVAEAVSAPPRRPMGKTIVGDMLMIDRDLYIVRGDLGEIQIEATPQTEIAETFQFGDRIKAFVLMNNKALTIERAGPDDVPGVVIHGARPSSPSVPDEAQAADKPVADVSSRAEATAASASVSGVGYDDETKVVEGQILMVDGDFYVMRGERGEIRIERTPDTRMTETFAFGDFIRATVTPTDQALAIERLR